MILFVDETGNDDYFIIVGMLVKSKDDVKNSYKSFKRQVQNMKLKPGAKAKVFNEFKSSIIDKNYSRIKIKMLNEIMSIDGVKIYTAYTKKENPFNQEKKEQIYIDLLKNIVSSITQDIEVIFDAFNKKDFENRIIEIISSYNHVLSVYAQESFNSPGIQYADNLCSVVRSSYLDSKTSYFDIIENVVYDVNKIESIQSK